MNTDDALNLTAVLVWLAAGGGTAVVAWAVAYLAEMWPAWHGLPVPVKFLVPVFVSFLLAVLASYALRFEEVLAIAQPYWAMLVTAVLGWIATQAGHNTAQARGVSRRAKLQ